MYELTDQRRRNAGLQWRADGAALAIERETPTEAAVGLSFDGRPHTVLMATPGDLDDLARGFTITEGVASFEDILSVEVRAGGGAAGRGGPG